MICTCEIVKILIKKITQIILLKVAEKITLKQSLFIKLSQDLAKLEGKETFASFAFSHNMHANPSMVPSLRVKGEEIQSTNQGGIPFLFNSRFPFLSPR